MDAQAFPKDYYDRIKPDLQRRIGREIRLARRVLDIGCGACGLTQRLAEAYRQEVTGIDISRRRFPRIRHSRDGVRYHCRQRDAASLNFAADGSIDAVVSVWALHEMADPRAVLAEVRRVLRPGGELVIVDFPAQSLAQELWDEAFYAPEDVRRLLCEAGFAEIQVARIKQDQVMWARAHNPASWPASTGAGNRASS